MEPINSDKLLNFVYYSIILFGLFMIIYMMYIDYISEKMSNINSNNKLSNNIIKRENILNSNQKLNIDSKQITEQFSSINPDLNYIIKRNYSNIENASCLKTDITNNNKCYMDASIFYPLQTLEKTYTISSLPYLIFDPVTNKETYYANIVTNNRSVIYNGAGNYRDTNFILSTEEKNRNLNENGELEMIIIDYIKRYISHYNKINSLNPSSTTQLIPEITTNTTYTNYIRDILLLKSSNIFNVNSNYDIPDIYGGLQKLINLYEVFYNDLEKYPGAELLITNNTKLVILVSPNTYSKYIQTNVVFSLTLKIYISIKLTNLTPVDASNNSANINNFNTLINNFKNFVYDKGKSYIYTEEKEIL
jgi:hypothetical protein